MVKVRDDYPLHNDGQIDLEAWVDRLQKQYKVEISDRAGLLALCQKTQQLDNQNGSHLCAFGLQMAEILAELRLDIDTLKAAVIYRAVRKQFITLEDVRQQAGDNIAQLVDGVLQMAAISNLMNPAKQVVFGQSSHQLENLRKMLVAMVSDVRVALIKLAERTCAIRAVKNADEEKRQRVAKEVFEIYAPLAHRLGIGHMKWELEDLSFRYLHPNAYKKIARLLDEKRIDRDKYIADVLDQLQTALAEVDIESKISGRAKHIYSIWRKMKRKNIDFYQVYDVRAVRILVPEVRDCYATLGIVHSLWKHIPREFDDYIAAPKDNGYRSLHTAVLGPEGKVLEVQIRTEQMHDEAEFGVCAHWHYKEGTKAKGDSNDDKILWLRQVLEWQEELGDLGLSSFITDLSREVVDERIYVFTPKGHVVDLAKGATPLDFAYHVHTEIGHRCRGAKVNGRIVPLYYELKIGEQIEILTRKEDAPSRDWLNPQLGYIRTSRARAKIVHWFKQQDREINVAVGKLMLQKELQRLHLSKIDRSQIARELGLNTTDELYAALSTGDVRLPQLLNLLHDREEKPPQTELMLRAKKEALKKSSGEFEVSGVDGLLTQIANCCKPVPGDEIMGYVTVGRGISVHREDCRELNNLGLQDPQRLVNVSWSDLQNHTYPVDIFIQAYDRQGLLRDITGVMTDCKVNMIAVNTHSYRQESTADMTITVDIDSLGTLGNLLTKISQLPNVFEVKRHHVGSNMVVKDRKDHE